MAAFILILSNTFNIVMAVFDVSESVLAKAGGITQDSTDISSSMIDTLEANLKTVSLRSLLRLWIQSFLIHVTMWGLNIVIFVIVYGHVIVIYLLTSLALLPVATITNRELGNMGQKFEVPVCFGLPRGTDPFKRIRPFRKLIQTRNIQKEFF